MSSKSYIGNWPARSSNKSNFLQKSKLENEIKLLNVFVKHKSLQLTAENIHATTAVIPVAASRNGHERVMHEFLAQRAFYCNQRQVTELAV